MSTFARTPPIMTFQLSSDPANATVGKHYEEAQNLAWLKGGDLGQRWIATYLRLVAFGVGHASHSDIRTDLVLRAMESEMMQRIAASEAETGGIGDIQGALSRYWVLSVYEMLRVAKDSDGGKTNEKLNLLYQQFRLVRVPVGKLEIARGNKAEGIELVREGADPSEPGRPYHGPGWRAQYRPPTFLRLDTGSIGWAVVDVESMTTIEITRRELSDELLTLFE
ncbi:MAG: hypothetical protein K9G59_11895 [Caulobacter sp.]|nr:hypothetical protein [Caulobacter sp.]